MTKDNQTIQQKIEQLDQAVAWFESDDFELEQASAKLKEAAKLAADIEHDLDNVANDIQIVKKSFTSDSE